MGSKKFRNPEKRAAKKAGVHRAVVAGAPTKTEGQVVTKEEQQKLKNKLDEFYDVQMKKHIHVDDFIDAHYRVDQYARWVLNHFRLGAALKMDFDPFMKDKLLFCKWNDKVYRVTGASRMGDVWLTDDFSQEIGYQHRVFVEEISGWAPTPGELEC